MGSETYELVRGLIAPRKPKELVYDNIVKELDTHFTPSVNVIVERFKFYDFEKPQNQSVKEYIAKLRELARTCRFGKSTTDTALSPQQVLEENLRDKFICEMKKNTRIQQRLLAEHDLTFDKATEIALSMELALQGVHMVSGSTHFRQEVYKVSNQKPKKFQPKQPHKPIKPCFRCGSSGHNPAQCKFKTAQCNLCKKVGHIKSNYFALSNQKQNNSSKQQNMIETSGTTGTEVYDLFTLKKHHTERITTEIMMNGKSINMEVDTGAAVTIIDRNTFKQHYKAQQEPELRKTSDVLRTYTGQQIHVEGVADVSVETNGQTKTLQLMVVPGDGPSLLGRNWLHEVNLDWSSINRCGLTLIDDLLKKYSNVFDPDGNSPIKGVVAKIHVPENTKPLYFRARPLPYALKNNVDVEIDRLLAVKIIEPVEISEWAAPVVQILKKDETIRRCGDYKVTVNKVASVDTYPIPRIDDLYAKLSNWKLFTRLDMRHAYEQLHLDREDRKFVTINTHRGLFTYTRMPYGVSSAPSIFQRVIDAMFQGIPNVLCYLDDILITGSSDEQLMDTLDKVLDKLSEAGIHLKQSKCEFMKHSVVFLGHKVDSQGVHPAGATLDDIRDARPPTNLTELRSFIGMVNHYARFIRGLSGKLTHLHMLLRKDTKWFWGTKQQQTFVEMKNILSSPPLVVHYDPYKPLVLTTDASEYGVGAVLSHTMEDGTDRPIACFSRTLSPPEKKYSQFDKEGLSIIYGLEKFHQFVYGRHVTIVTDHKPTSNTVRRA